MDKLIKAVHVWVDICMADYTDSRTVPDELVALCLELARVDRITEEDADKCPWDGKFCWHYVQGHCIHISGTVPKGKPCDRHPDGKGGGAGG
jgi:hypothetical protein